jgi:ribose transport system ATP-binding protein
MDEPVLKIEGVGKRFFGVRVLSDVSFSLGRGRILGLVGENGAGKSTLMNVLGGVLPADSGRVVLAGADHAPKNPAEAARAGIAFIHQELNLFHNLSIAENLFLAEFPRRRIAGISLIDRRAVREKTRALLTEVGLEQAPETLIEHLAPGERQLVEVAKALAIDARVIILDEPTTSLTSPEAERLFEIVARLRARGISMIYISHQLGDVLRLCDDVVVLRDGEVQAAGPADQFDAQRMIAQMIGRSMDRLFPPRTATPPTRPVLEVRALSQPGIVRRISFTLHAGEVLGIAGLMGAGRTELTRILFGLDPFKEGEVRLLGRSLGHASPAARVRRGLALVTEDRRREGLLMEASVAENAALAALPSFSRWRGLVDRRRLHSALNAAVRSLAIGAAAIDRQAVKTLSGGNQQKVVLAKWLLNKPSVFILDEPTRGIDVGAKFEVHRIINDLAAAGVGVLLISAELEELMGMCDRILVMRKGEITARAERAGFDREALLRAALGEGPQP